MNVNTTYRMLLAAGLLAAAIPAVAADYERPARESTPSERMRERPDDTHSRYPDTKIDKGPAAHGNEEPPQDGSAMEMNDETNNINDSTLEMPRRR